MDRDNKQVKTFLVIIKEPFLDRIPSLKTLLMFLAEKGNTVNILTSVSEKFILNTFSHKNISFIKVRQRTKKIELPTFIKLSIRAFSFLLTNKVNFIIGGDAIGNCIASKLSNVFKIRHLNFQLEFPQIITDKHKKLTKLEKLENKSISNADYVITHDVWHKDFLVKNLGVDSNKILTLPNSSFTPIYKQQSDFLRKRLDISDNDIIILHSGGLGKWFRSKELAESTKSWDNNMKLVFHTSHKLKGDNYFESIYNKKYSNVKFSLEPVSTYELDSLIASATIGIAIYSISELDYRAKYMGLAAGKIGNYLKCGIPVIATRLPSLTYIEDFKCGILIDNECDILNAIKKITSDMNFYKQNAYSCYEKLWHPQKSLENILGHIDNN